MSIKESEEIILEVSSEKEFNIRIQEALNRENHPVLQALILINMFRSLEELAQKASNNHEPEEAALSGQSGWRQGGKGAALCGHSACRLFVGEA